jgi:hypothetical protein
MSAWARALLLALPLALRAEGAQKVSIVVKSLGPLRTRIGIEQVLRVQLKGPLPKEDLGWRLDLGDNERASGVLFLEAGVSPPRSFEISFRFTTEDLTNRSSRAVRTLDSKLLPSQTCPVHAHVYVFKAGSGELVKEKGVDFMIVPPRGLRRSEVIDFCGLGASEESEPR